MQQRTLDEARQVQQMGYAALAEESAAAWAHRVWNNVPVNVESTCETDALALRFAQYHLYVMTPAHDNRMTEGEDGKLHILDVVGPDEYKEHVDDNAFTNYMAHWNIQKAIEHHDMLKAEKPELFARLDEKLGLAEAYPEWKAAVDRVYLPQPREDGVIPQNATYLTLRDIDLTKYKNQDHVGSLFEDYNLEQVNKIQVTKQADTLLLFLLMENLFDLRTKKANWDYYEPRTLHDSSLSLSTHCIIAADMNDSALAYDLFRRAAFIDAGPDMKSSSAGIRAINAAGMFSVGVGTPDQMREAKLILSGTHELSLARIREASGLA